MLRQPDLILCPFLTKKVPAAIYDKYMTLIVHVSHLIFPSGETITDLSMAFSRELQEMPVRQLSTGFCSATTATRPTPKPPSTSSTRTTTWPRVLDVATGA